MNYFQIRRGILKIDKKGQLLAFLLGLILTAIMTRFLLPPFPLATHDHGHEVRLMELDRAVKDGQFLARWSPDLWFGFGAPVFLFYNPLFYYLSEIFHLLGLNLISSIKVGVIFSLFGSFFFTYLLTRQLWGRWGGLISATIYLLAPYHLGDVFVRGAFAENLALFLLPMVFWAFYNLSLSQKRRYFLLATFSLTSLILSHNITALIAFPFLLAFLSQLTKKNPLISCSLSFLPVVFALCLSAFFWLPALLEVDYTQVREMTLGGYFNFKQHFIYPQQLVSLKWEYGLSVPGADDEMSFQVGLIHLGLSFLVLIAIISNKLPKEKLSLTSFSLTAAVIALFFTTSFSTPFWEVVPLLPFTQFPWRFLTLTTFFIGLAAGSSVFLFAKHLRKIFALAIILLTLVLNLKYTHPSGYINYQTNDCDFTPKGEIVAQITKQPFKKEVTIYSTLQERNFLPKTVDVSLAEDIVHQVMNEVASQTILLKTKTEQQKIACSFQTGLEKLKILRGEVKVLASQLRTDEYSFTIEVARETQFRLNTFWFPGWQVFVDQKPAKINYKNPLGVIEFEVKEGKHHIKAKFGRTRIRLIADLVSGLSLLIFLIIGGKPQRFFRGKLPCTPLHKPSP